MKSSSNVWPLVRNVRLIPFAPTFAPSLKQQDNTGYTSLFSSSLLLWSTYTVILYLKRSAGGTPPGLVEVDRSVPTLVDTQYSGGGGVSVSSSGRGLGNNSALLPDAVWLVGNVTQTNSVRFLCKSQSLASCCTHTSVWASLSTVEAETSEEVWHEQRSSFQTPMQEQKVSKSVRFAPLPAAAEARNSSAEVQPRNVGERQDEKIRREAVL